MAQLPYSVLPTISVLGDSRYLPAEVDIDQLAVGVCEETLSGLNLHHEHMIVGERRVNDECNNTVQKSYGLIVDDHGVLVNCTIPDRANPDTPRQYALQVEGSMYVSGSLHANNLLLDIALEENIMALAYAASSNPWRFVNRDANTNAVFYDGNVTVGNESFASISPNPIFIVEGGDLDIRRSQFAIANLQLSKLNVGILGNAPNSPVVFHSTRAPIEFNVGRPPDYYTKVYQEYYTDGTTPSPKLRRADVPLYSPNTASAPHMTIDKHGNVGIHIAETPTITYNRREKPTQPYDPILVEYTDTMTFAVSGPMFASNILIYDPDTNSAKDINELYARIKGTFLPAKQVIPGDFAIGDYVFPGSLAIATPTEYVSGSNGSFGFAVGTPSHFHENVVMDKNLFASNIQSEFLVNTNAVDFRGTLGVTGMTNTYGDLVVHKGISVAERMPNGDFSYKNVQFSYFGESLSNVNYFGKGLTTPGQFGVGISPYILDDVPAHMLSIRNREFKPKMYELELEDLRDPNIRKIAWLGHAHTDRSSRAFDGSFVISTPMKADSRYNVTSTYTNPVQNIYLYPGHDLRDQSLPLLRQTNPPVFAAFAPQEAWTLRQGANVENPAPHEIYGRCGINTFTPRAELHVEGDIAFTRNLVRINPDTGAPSRLGIWERLEFEDTGAAISPQYTGIQYLDPAAAHVGINTLPSPNYGAVVAGKLKSINGYFTAEDEEIVSWIRPDGREITFQQDAPTLYSQGPIGIGITDPVNVMEIKQRANGPTLVHLKASLIDPRTGFRITGGTGDVDGTGYSHSWYMQDNSATSSFELFASSAAAAQPTALEQTGAMRAFQVVRNPLLNTYNTFINRTAGLDITTLSNVSRNAALTINGDLNVIGNVFATQKYHSSNIVVASSDIQGTSQTLSNIALLGTDDVMIAGRYIHMLPIGGTVIVGADGDYMQRFITPDTGAGSGFRFIPMRVHNGSAEGHPIAMSFSTSRSQCYMEFNASGRRLWMGLDNERFSVKRIDNTSGATVQNFMTFANVGGVEGLGINEPAPKALLHVSNTSDNQLRVTRKLTSSIGGACPSIQLETLTTSAPIVSRIWSLSGPDLGTNDKLALFYNANLPGDTAPIGLGQELFTFSKNGGLGIGNTDPEYALDIKSTESFGGVRLWSTDTEAKPQLVFQSGASGIFGGDAQTDFRMLTYQSVFEFNAQTEGSGTVPVMRVNAAGKIGFGTSPYEGNDEIRINVRGGINIDDQLYVNGQPLFDSNKRDGFTFAATNIFVIPTAADGGSFLVNSTRDATSGTCNLFQIYVDAYDPENPLDEAISRGIVLDGRGDEVQLTFRTHDMDASVATAYLYRQWQNKRTFGLEFMDPAPIEERVGFSHEGWSNVVKWEPLLSPVIRDQFTMKNYGDIELHAPSPTLRLGEDLTTATYVGQRSGHMYFEAAPNKNIGIGTQAPAAYVHIRNANAAAGVPALYVEHTQEDVNHLAVFGALANPDMVITADGRIGVGVGNTVAPTVAAEIAGVVATARGTSAAPALVYRGDLSTGWWSPAASQVALSAAGVEVVRFDDLRAVGMGTTAPVAHLHINTTESSVAHTTSIPSVRIDYNYPAAVDTPIFDMYSSNALVFRATNDGRIGFGTAATTADFQVKKGFQFESVGQFDGNVLFNQNIVVKGDVRHGGVVTHDSDRRLKNDLLRIDNALDRVDRLTGYTYTVAATNKRSTGLIAQDVAEVLPEAVEEKEDTLGVAYGNMMGLVMEAIKELRAEVKSIKTFVGM